MNWDGILDLLHHGIGMGGIVRDHGGAILATTCCIILSQSTIPVVAEALALSKMMILCEEMSFTQLNFEGDYLTVVMAANGEGEGHKATGSIIFDVHYILSAHSD